MKIQDLKHKLSSSKFFRIRTLIILAVLSLLLLAGVLIWKLSVVERIDRFLTGVIYRVSPKSTAEVSVEQESASESAYVKLRFVIIPIEQAKFDGLAKKLDLGQSWPSEIAVGVNEETSDWLKGLLPLTLNLTLTEQHLSFGNLTLRGLVSSQVRNEYKYASGSGSLRMNISNVHDIDLEIYDLGSVVREASKSGELYVSPILSQVGGVIDQVKSVNLRIIGNPPAGGVNGQIEFWP